MSVNKCILVGRLGKDPEVRYMANGEAVTNCSIACNEQWKDKSGAKQEKVEYINLVFFKRLAEIAGEYLKKGALIYVEGKITTEKWTDKEGKDRYTTKIIAHEMKMLGGKPGGESQEHTSTASPNTSTARPAQAPKPSSFDNFDDDIPFMWHGAPGAGVSWRAM